jgi:hypothetical protein
VADADDAIRRLDDLDALARHHGVIPAFRWPDGDDEEVEGCLLRVHRGETTDEGLAVLEIGALDGSWTEHYLVGAEHLEAACRASVVDGPGPG